MEKIIKRVKRTGYLNFLKTIKNYKIEKPKFYHQLIQGVLNCGKHSVFVDEVMDPITGNPSNPKDRTTQLIV